MRSTVKLTSLVLLVCLASSLHISHRPQHERQGVRHQVAWGHYNSELKPDRIFPAWISYIPDDKLISQLSIPGTHDSGTYNCKWDQLCDASQCQSWSIFDQLEAGIKFLDLRINTDGSTLSIGHGPFTFISLFTALSDVKRFLDENPTEFVILSFQKNRGEQQKTDQITNMMSSIGLNTLLTGGRIPTVGELRGKVWITHSYGSDIYGSYPLFGRQGVTDDSDAYMQNMYTVFAYSVSEKRDLVLKTAQRNCDDNRLKVNYLSGSGGVMPYHLAKIDGGTNQALDAWLKGNPKGCLGITVMDYPGTALIRQIIDSNM